LRYLGDYQAGKTVYVYFDTFGSSGESLTMTGLAVTDIEIYKNGSITQRSSDSGYTLLDTDGIDFDLITGIHAFSIDLSDNTDAGFFAAGSDYTVVLSSVTINTQVVSFIAAEFSIENRAGALAVRPTTAGRTLDITTTGAAGIDWGNVENPTTTINFSSTTIGVVTTNTDLISAATIADAVWDELLAGHVISDSAGLVLNELQDGGRIDLLIDGLVTSLTTAQADLDIITGSDGVTLATVQTLYIPATAAIVNAQMVDALNVDTYAEPSSIPSSTSSIVDKVGMIFALSTNRFTQTASLATIRNSANSADIGTGTVSDDGTTAIRGVLS
jgi:hypothetical protein